MHTSISFSTSKIIALFIVTTLALTAATAFAAKNYNSAKSNTVTSIAKVNEEVGNILLRYTIGGAEINKVTDALAAGIAEEKLITLLVEVGINKENVKAVLAEFDKLGIAGEDAAGSAVSVPPSTNVVTSPVSTSSVKKCGVNTYRVSNECGVGAFKNVYVQCYDGYEENLGGESSCKSSEVWQKYAQEICVNRCGIAETKPAPLPEPVPTPASKPSTAPCPLMPTVDSCPEGKEKVVAYSSPECGTYYTCRDLTPVKPIAICYIPDKLTKDYNQLLLDLRKAESDGDKEAAEAITRKITALKLEIERYRKECLANTTVQQPSIQPPTIASRPHAPVAVDRCQEVSQWENKIAYYQKLAALSDAELKERTGFSPEEVKRILAELPEGLVKVEAQCDEQKTAGARPSATVKQIIAEPVKPVAVGSGQEISDYYKAKIETITAQEDTDVQIEKLKSLKGEIDDLIVKLLKNRKEIEASELGNAVVEIKVSRGEIKADDVAIKTTDKKILVNVGDSAVSVAPTSRQVLIQDKNLEVAASEVSIKDNSLWVGNSEVKLAASKVAETLGVESQSAELKEENSRAVYKLKVAEPRKLFGFIPVRMTKTMTADAESSDLLNEKLPWYSFLTTK